MAPTTVPCQYKTGKVLGQGTYAVVKECVHITTGQYYACKVINKRLMEGREAMVRNEINVLKKVSVGHKHIVTLHDYFETMNNLYLVTDLCTGGELFDRICAKGSYFEKDARHLIAVITSAVAYLHERGIIHRDLKPENLLFRSKDEDADLLIADFGLSKMIDDQKMTVLTTTCGTPGYMAPEIFRKEGHHKPVDIWAIGVITYFLLCGYTPFDRDNNAEEIKAICAADYKFEPEEYWEHVSEPARDFIRQCLTIDQRKRPTAEQLFHHPWLKVEHPGFVTDDQGRHKDLLPHVRKGFNAKTSWKSAFTKLRAANTFKGLDSNEQKIQRDVTAAQAEAESEHVEHGKPVEVAHDSAHHHQHHQK